MKKSELIAAAEKVVGELSEERRAELIYYAQRIGVLEVVRILDGIKRSPGKYGWYTLLGQLSREYFRKEENNEHHQQHSNARIPDEAGQNPAGVHPCYAAAGEQ